MSVQRGSAISSIVVTLFVLTASMPRNASIRPLDRAARTRSSPPGNLWKSIRAYRRTSSEEVSAEGSLTVASGSGAVGVALRLSCAGSMWWRSMRS